MAGDLGDAVFSKLLKLILKTTIGQLLMLIVFGAAAVAVGVYTDNWYFAILYGVLVVLLVVLKILRRDRPGETPVSAASQRDLEALTPLSKAVIWLVWFLVASGFWVLKTAIAQKNETWLFAAAGFYGLIFLWCLVSGRVYWGGPSALVQRDRQPLVYLVVLTVLLAACAGPLVLYGFFWDNLQTLT